MRFSSLLVIAALIAPLSEGPALAGAPRGQPRIPARLLRCEVGRITNIDPARNQTLVDFVREGRFAVSIYLPSAPAPAGPPPDPADDPAPVDPQVRILVDSAKIFAAVKRPFDRVVDRWPERVELVSRVAHSEWNRFIAITDIAPAAGTANIFTSRVVDAGSMDLNTVYQGRCTVTMPGHSQGGRPASRQSVRRKS